MPKKKINKKLSKLICIRCKSSISKLAEGGGSICYQCPKCSARYCFGLNWQIYDEKKFDWINV